MLFQRLGGGLLAVESVAFHEGWVLQTEEKGCYSRSFEELFEKPSLLKSQGLYWTKRQGKEFW